jgi:hypothetical protein
VARTTLSRRHPHIQTIFCIVLCFWDPTAAHVLHAQFADWCEYDYNNRWVYHGVGLCVADSFFILGGSLLAGAQNSIQEFNSNMVTAKAMRTAGQGVFLTINVFLVYCIIDTIRQSRREIPDKGTHPTLLLLLATWPLLFVRGLYGVMSAVLPAFNYFNPNNYGETGLLDSFVISEYIMGTTMEWTSCTLLMATYLTSRNDSKKEDLKMSKDKDARLEGV